jgi:hypothetical protein
MSLVKKLIVLGIVVVIVGAFLWFSPYFQNSTNSSYNASYTSLTLRDGMNNTATLEFGDTEYNFDYSGGILMDSTFIELSKSYTPHKGDTYRDFGMEVKVSDVTSDYISNYIVILVKPTVQNYMASLHYTEVNLTLNEGKSVSISSGLTNETHEYGFTYTQVKYASSYYESYLTVDLGAQENKHQVIASSSASWASDIRDLNIEIRVFKVELQYMVIYVKPLY